MTAESQLTFLLVQCNEISSLNNNCDIKTTEYTKKKQQQQQRTGIITDTERERENAKLPSIESIQHSSSSYEFLYEKWMKKKELTPYWMGCTNERRQKKASGTILITLILLGRCDCERQTKHQTLDRANTKNRRRCVLQITSYEL